MNNRKLLLFTALFLAWMGVNAQRATSGSVTVTHAPSLHNHGEHTEKKVRCYTMEAEARRIANDPTAQSLDEFENWLQKQMADPKVQAKARVVYNIPVIVHVIHNGTGVGSGSNLSQSQINSQFDVLNEDFRRTNADAANTPSVFAGVAADCEINFCKALVDPNGNVLAEPGIHRINRNTMGFSAPPYSDTYIDGTIKPATYWDPTKYLNIWVCDLGQQLLGYAQFPTGSGLQGLAGGATAANTDGVVILYQAFGRTGNLISPYNKGRTATHEIGHWLGLRHIGGDGTSCNATDYCNDTPPQKGGFSGGQFNQNYGCPSFPYQSGCNSANGDMFMNYMDYTDDGCMNIFTAGQKARMQTVMSVSPRRASLNTSTACNSVTPTAPIASFTYSPTQPCAGAAVQFTNTSTGSPTTYSWTFSGGTPATAITMNASSTFATAGSYTVTLFVSNAQGSNSTSQTIVVKDCSSGSGGCDSLLNITMDDTLALYTVAQQDGGGYVSGHNGYSDKAFADYYAYTAPANATLSDLILAFGVGKAGTANGKVTARVWANNGGTPGAVLGSVDIPLSTIASDVTAQAATIAPFATPINITGSFFAGFEVYYAAGDTAAILTNRDGNTPTGTAWTLFSDNSWHAFSESPANWGLNVSLYAIPVICTPATAVDPKLVGNIGIYPNPNDGKFTLAMTKAVANNAEVKIFNLQGQLVFQKNIRIDNGTAFETFDLVNLSNGTYFVQIESNGARSNHKIVIAK